MSFNKDALLHKLQDENKMLVEELNDLEEQLYMWEEVPDEDLWEDGELERYEAYSKATYHIFIKGDWKLMRRRDNE